MRSTFSRPARRASTHVLINLFESHVFFPQFLVRREREPLRRISPFRTAEKFLFQDNSAPEGRLRDRRDAALTSASWGLSQVRREFRSG